jgi:hypothetical protein
VKTQEVVPTWRTSGANEAATTKPITNIALMPPPPRSWLNRDSPVASSPMMAATNPSTAKHRVGAC